MESTRDVSIDGYHFHDHFSSVSDNSIPGTGNVVSIKADAVSTRISDTTSTSSSTISQRNEPKSDKNNATVNKNTEKLALITEAINETIAENNARGREINELFSLLDLDPKSMPRDIQDSWNEVSAILRAEGLSDLNPISLKLHMERKKRESKKKAWEERKLKAKYKELCDRHAGVLEMQNEIRNAVEMLQGLVETAERNGEDEYADRIFMATKLNEYRQALEKLDEELKEIGAEEYNAKQILEKYETYLTLNEELSDVEQSLSKYGELPPNLLEARLLVEEKEKYLKDLDCALYEKMHKQ